MAARRKNQLFNQMPLGQHPLVENPADDNRLAALAIEDHMSSLFDAAAVRANRIIRAPYQRRIGNLLNAFLNLSDITKGLIGAPLLSCVSRYRFQIGKRKT